MPFRTPIVGSGSSPAPPDNHCCGLGPRAADPTLGPAAGSGATLDGFSVYDRGGFILFTAGASPTSGILFEALFSTPYTSGDVFSVYQPGNQEAAVDDIGARLYDESGNDRVRALMPIANPLVEGMQYKVVWHTNGTVAP